MELGPIPIAILWSWFGKCYENKNQWNKICCQKTPFSILVENKWATFQQAQKDVIRGQQEK